MTDAGDRRGSGGPSLLERLAAGDVLVSDGGLGSQLLARGLPAGACPESWNLSHPEVIAEIARDYLEAGSDLVTANTFGGSPLKLGRHGLAEKMEAINKAAVAIALCAAAGRALVCGCIGPSARILRPYGDADPEEVRASFARQARVLAGAGVHAFFIETMTDLAEAVLAVRAAKAEAPALPVFATMTFDPTSRGFFTIMGNDVPSAAAGLEAAGADAVGSNCGHGIETMVAIAREFRRSTRLPLMIQSNAGLPSMVGDRAVYAETPAFMAEKAHDLLAIGVSVIGGCCGTTPEHIRAIRGVVDAR